MTVVVLTTPGTGTWPVPADCPVGTVLTVEDWGAGGGGGGSGSGGAGGGAWASDTYTVTSGDVTSGIPYSIGAGGAGAIFGVTFSADGGPTWWATSTTLLADGGSRNNGNTAGPGGTTAASIGASKFAGGNGANGGSGGGAGGAGGKDGAGQNGGNGVGGAGDNGFGGAGGASGSSGTSNVEGGGGGGRAAPGGNGGAPGGAGAGASGTSQNGGSGADGQIRITYTPSGGGGSVSPGTGSLAFTGFAPRSDATSAPPTGSLILTGFAPRSDGTTAPGAGGFILTGFAPSVPDGGSVSPGTGSLIFTGFAPSLPGPPDPPGDPPPGDQANAVVQGTLTGTGSTPPFAFYGPFNVSLWGTFSGTTLIERSFDHGTTWLTRSDLLGHGSYTAPITLGVVEPERGVLYRLRCSVFASGTISYRLSATGAAAMAWPVGSSS